MWKTFQQMQYRAVSFVLLYYFKDVIIILKIIQF